jgi:LysR family transcriptional regulator, nitrogen assimilation regulatory protein
LPLVLFCRPSSWRNDLERIAADGNISLNVALEADSLSDARSLCLAAQRGCGAKFTGGRTTVSW